MSNTSTGYDKTINFTMDIHIDRLMALTEMNECTLKDNLAIKKPLGTYIYRSPGRETYKCI